MSAIAPSNPKWSDWSMSIIEEKESTLSPKTKSRKSLIKLRSCSTGLLLGMLSNGITLAIVITIWIKSFKLTSIIITNEIPPGTILLFTGDLKKLNGSTHRWLLCDGSEVSRFMYQDLFDVIGETYGSGNGNNTFNLPDFRGRFALGSSSSNASGLVKGGAATHVLTLDEMPRHAHTPGTFILNASGIHTHTVVDPGHNHGGSTGSATQLANGNTGNWGFSSGGDYYSGSHSHSISSDTTHITLQSNGSHTHSLQGNTSFEGNSTAIDMIPPYQTIHYIIRA